MKHTLLPAMVLLVAAVPLTLGDEPPPGSDYEGQAFTFHKVRDDVYHAVGTGNLAVGCNGAVIVNDRDVLVVDSHMTPAAAWALREELRAITDKPIRYVVNTHFHFDHSHGNQVFGDDVEIIAHTFTHGKLARGESQKGRAYESFVLSLPTRIEEGEGRLPSLEGEEKEQLAEQVEGMKKFWEATQAVRPTPPTMTLERTLTLHRGGREIRLHYFGRGHTGGDVVVYLPGEKVLVSGDLITAGLPYMGDGFIPEWIETLEAMKALDFDVILPGHGAAFEDTAKIGYLQAYLRDLWAKASALHEEGVPVEEAAGKIDMTAHAEHFSGISGPGVSDHAVARIYELLDGGA